MRKEFNRVACIATVGVMSLQLTACSSNKWKDVMALPLEQELTSQELIDYYAKALEYDTIVSRPSDDNKASISYNITSIPGSKEDSLKKLVERAESILALDEYSYDGDNEEIVPEDTYIYIKSIIDDKVLSGGTIKDIGGALGFYFVDVEYDVSSQKAGEFNNNTPLLGLNGVWLSQYYGYDINTAYMQTVMNKMNQYYTGANLKMCAYYDAAEEEFKILNGVDPMTYGLYIGESKDNAVDADGIEEVETDETVGSTEDAVEAVDEPVVEQVNVPQPEEEYQESIVSYESLTDEDRRMTLDTKLINDIVGSSMSQRSFLPDLKLVYDKPSAKGDISGFGIYPQANSGLKIFGYDRSNVNGTATLRYVFKDDTAASGKILGYNIYIMEEEIATGTTVASGNVLIPNYLEQQLKNLIERADRVQCNVDLSGMMNNEIYEDMGFAVLAGFKDSGCYTMKHMSTIRQILDRDIENNAYLLEVESTIVEGPRSVDAYGTYRDKYYVVVQQQGDKFIISDMALESRTMTSEPIINPDSAIQKRLVALNLSGEVSDSAREEATKLMSELYTAGTNRILNTQEVNGVEIKGMYDCFNKNSEMYSSSEMEYDNALLRSHLIKYGTNVKSVHSGNITEFIGGWDNQVEFTTEELIIYDGVNEGYYMQVYYLISKMDDYWVIDERTVIDEYSVSDAELQSIRDRIGI